jgi:hypothetical protein
MAAEQVLFQSAVREKPEIGEIAGAVRNEQRIEGLMRAR